MAIKKFVILLDADIASVPNDWLIKKTADAVAPLRPPTQVGKTYRVVPRAGLPLQLVENHVYTTVTGAKVRGGIYTQ